MDSNTKHIHVINENVYDDYTSDIFRSLPEKRFESFCVSCGKVKWYYKNGDKGQKYFSIAYVDNFGAMNLFYPDYLLMTNDGKFFIVETKGGKDSEGESRNIDKDKVELKFKMNMDFIVMMFGFGMIVHMVCSVIMYRWELKKNNISIAS